MISTRLNSDLKPSFMLFIDENPSSSALGFQTALAFSSEVSNKFSKVFLFLNEPKRKFRMNSNFQLIDLFSNAKLFDEFEMKNEEKSLILIDALPWLLVDQSESFLIRRLNAWRQKHLVIGVLPFDCLDDEKTLKNLIAISNWTIRVRAESNVEMRIEKVGKTSIDTIKSILRFSFDENSNVVELREEKFVKKKAKTTNSSSDVTANLTFNLRLKNDELTAKNQLVLPYTKQNSTTNDDQFTIHYSYEKEDDIDEDEDDDLTL